jgi:hypothetical protein
MRVMTEQREHEMRAMKRQLEEDFEREIAKVCRLNLLRFYFNVYKPKPVFFCKLRRRVPG